jgi:RNA polymerase-binding transcription factor DksA
MAKFINTRKAVAEIEDLIRNAEEKLILISPFLKLAKDFKELLTYRDSKEKITHIVFGKQELNPDEMKFLQGLRSVYLKYNENLHAKCYLNDNKMIITSLNLYEFSMANNKEMGVLIEKNDPVDAALFEDAMKEVDYIFKTSEKFEFGNLKEAKDNDKKKTKKDDSVDSKKGYCIRTGVEIPFNVEKPFCYEAYKDWSKDEDEENPEMYCHFSGEFSPGETSYSKPILKKHWKKAKEVHNL